MFLNFVIPARLVKNNMKGSNLPGMENCKNKLFFGELIYSYKKVIFKGFPNSDTVEAALCYQFGTDRK
jgi:hypothetical protein